jgi:hypothetical protein
MVLSFYGDHVKYCNVGVRESGVDDGIPPELGMTYYEIHKGNCDQLQITLCSCTMLIHYTHTLHSYSTLYCTHYR